MDQWAYFNKVKLDFSRPGKARETAKNIIWDVRRFIGLADQNDDMSLVVIKIK